MAVSWFKGDVSTAVNDAKNQQANLMIFIASDDEYTLLYKKVLDSFDFSKKHYVALKIEAYTEEFEQFKSIYRIVPVPSILVIDWESGLVMERISGATFDEDLQELLLEAIGDLPVNSSAAPDPVEPIIVPDESKNAKQVKIQFKIPSGETKTQIYKPDDVLSSIRNDVASLFKLNSFTLAVPYPRRLLTAEDEALSLLELSLVPSSTILVIPNQAESIVPWNIFGPLWKLINVVLAYFRSVWSRFLPPTNENTTEEKKTN